jgi:cyclic AMP-responsive element-binding protein 3
VASESSGSESGGTNSSPSSSSSSPKSGHGAPVQLSSEERALMLREGVRVPTHYPLSREEQRALTRIRRKIRNKASAQDSRKRRKAYLHNMEERVERCSLENDELKSKARTNR